MPLLTTSTTIAASYCTAVASSCPVIRKSPSPATQTTTRSGCSELRRHRGRHAVAHRAAVGASCVPVAAERVEAVHQTVKLPAPLVRIASARQALAQVSHHLAPCRASPGARSCTEVGEVVGARAARPSPRTARAVDGGRSVERRGELRRAGDDRQVGLVDAAELVRRRRGRARASARARRLDQRVAGGGHLAQPRADREQQVGLRARAAASAGSMPMPSVARVDARAVVDVVLAAERGRDRQLDALGEARDRRGPPASLQPLPPTISERPLGARRAARAGALDVRRGGRRPAPAGSGSRVGDVAPRRTEHVLGQREHDRPRPARRSRCGRRARRARGSRSASVDRRAPTSPSAPNMRAVVDLLERLALERAGAAPGR